MSEFSLWYGHTTDPRISAVKPVWIRPSFSQRKWGAKTALAPARPDQTHPGPVRHAFNAPNSLPVTSSEPFRLHCSGRFRPVLASPNPPKFRGRKPSPAAASADGMVILEPFWERPAGTQTHSRRTEAKLGHLRCVRQGLVRVSESNTKYGGKGRKTGAVPCL